MQICSHICTLQCFPMGMVSDMIQHLAKMKGTILWMELL